jgi:DNA polymerase III, alpha subunit (EC 2.7.7.7)
MAAVLSRNISNIVDITRFMDECKAMGILVLGPDVNESNLKFTVNKEGNIRFGLGAIKGVGESAVEAIIQERDKNGPFAGIFDFVQRVNLTACNKKNLENIALAGGFDNFPELKREQFFAVNTKGETFLETLVRYGNKFQLDREQAANSLFGGDNVIDIATPEIFPAERWSDLERLNKEKELVGIYLSAHPLDEYSIILKDVCNTKMVDFSDRASLVNKELTFGGIVTNVREGMGKTGKPYAIVKFEDFSGSNELPFFGNDYIEWRNFLSVGMFLYIKGRCQPRQWKQDELDIKITSMELLPDVKDTLIEKMTIFIPLKALDQQVVTELSILSNESPGKTELFFKIFDEESNYSVEFMARSTKLSVGKKIVNYINEHPELEYHIN